MNTETIADKPSPSLFRSVVLFLRFEYLVFALLLPLYGAFTVTQALTPGLFLSLLAGAFLFHVYVSVLNDVVDLELDRTRPDRADYPLVRGAISRSRALSIALICVPLVYGLTYFLNGGIWAYIALSTGIVMMGIYDLWGKKTRAPLVIDIVQGAGFAAMTVYGADIVGEPTRLTAVVFGAVVLWMMNTNLYAGFRDLKTDTDYGLYTSPIMLGAIQDGNRLIIPRRAIYYSLWVQAALFALAFLALGWNDFGYGPAVQSTLAAITGVLALIAGAMTWAFYHVAGTDYDDMYHIARMIYATTGGAWLVLFFPLLNGWLIAFIVCVFIWNYQSFNLTPFQRCRELIQGRLPR